VPAGDLEGLMESACVYSSRTGRKHTTRRRVSERTELVARAADLGQRWPDLAPA